MSATTTVTLGNKSFELDTVKAEEAFAAKKVINGRDTMFFNILPIKYQWAYDLYKLMKSNHWEPEGTALRADAAQWGTLSEGQQKTIEMLIGYIANSGDITGAELIYSIRDLVTAPELKLVFGRYVHEQNTQQDILVHVLSSIGINATTCDAAIIPAGSKVQALTEKHLVDLDRSADMTELSNKQAFARNTFMFSQCMEGLQFYSLYASVLELGRTGTLVGLQEIVTKLLRDTGFRCELFRKLFSELTQENPDIRTAEFDDDLVAIMNEAVVVEKAFIAELLPANNGSGLNVTTLNGYIDHIASRRLAACGLGPRAEASPLPWLDEIFFPSDAHATTQATAQATDATNFEDDDL